MIVHYNKVDKDFFLQHAKNLIEKNFDLIAPYFITRSDVFKELVVKIHEVNSCLIFDCFSASISLTNHILERLLKISLVYNETGLGQVRMRDINNHFGPAHNKYQSEDLYKTINLCCSAGLITKEHKKYLNDEIREKLRNGFSHSDPNKMLKNDIFVWNDKSITTDVRLDPLIQSTLMYNLAQEQALPYFQYIVGLIIHIEKVLIENDRKRKNKDANL